MREYWAGVRSDEIVHGLQIPTEFIEKYLPLTQRSPRANSVINEDKASLPWFEDILELGAGTGEQSILMAGTRHFRVRAVDIHSGVADLYKEVQTLPVLSGGVGDVTKWGSGIGKDSILKLERFNAVVIQAVMPSLIDDRGVEWKKMLDAALMWTRPNGYLFIHEIVAGDYYYSEVARQVGPAEWERQRKNWARRYRNNQEAFESLALPMRGFIVGKPGTEGKEMELGNAETLRELHRRSDLFERFAQHVDPIELKLHLRRLGYTQLEERMGHYQSRGGSQVAPTILSVFKKGSIFQYDPVARGLNVNISTWEAEALDIYHQKREQCEMAGVKYFWQAMDEVARYAPSSQVGAVLALRDQF